MNPVDQSRQLPAARRTALLQYLAEQEQLTVGQLADHFDVSIDTIRRDLDQLDVQGLLVRTHGGAMSTASIPRIDRGLDVRLHMQTQQKEAIAGCAIDLIRDESVVMFNGGTTTLTLARRLGAKTGLTVATNNLRIPSEIPAKCLRQLYVFGGPVRTVAQTTMGSVSFLRPGGEAVGVKADVAMIGVGAVSVHGYSTSDLGDAAMMADMMGNAACVVVLADSSKFDKNLFAQATDLSAADYLVTDSAPPVQLAEALADVGVKVLTP